MTQTDVTDSVDFDFGSIDGELLPLTKCVCGAKWSPWSGPGISIYEDSPNACPECGRKFYFAACIKVYEVHDK